jgi:FtsZ-binding cell division protein ZapB
VLSGEINFIIAILQKDKEQFRSLAMDPLSLTVSIAALIGTTTQILGYLNDVKTASKERAKLASEVANLMALLTSIRYKVEEAEEEKNTWYNSVRSLLGGANGPLDQFRSALEELAGKLDPATGLKKISRTLIWTLDRKECIDILAKIERLKTLIGLASQEDLS